ANGNTDLLIRRPSLTPKRRSKTYRVHLSHHRSDREQVEIIATRLREESGFKAFLDQWCLEPGDSWHEQIEAALDDSACCAVFLGPSGLTPWQNDDMRAALEKRIRDGNTGFLHVICSGTCKTVFRRRIAMQFTLLIHESPEAFASTEKRWG